MAEAHYAAPRDKPATAAEVRLLWAEDILARRAAGDLSAIECVAELLKALEAPVNTCGCSELDYCERVAGPRADQLLEDRAARG